MARRSALVVPGRRPPRRLAELSRAHESVLQEHSSRAYDLLHRQHTPTVPAVYHTGRQARNASYRVTFGNVKFLFAKPREARLPSGRGKADKLISLLADPRVLFCVRRRRRREVMFAYNVAGRGGRRGRRFRRNFSSQFSC